MVNAGDQSREARTGLRAGQGALVLERDRAEQCWGLIKSKSGSKGRTDTQIGSEPLD